MDRTMVPFINMLRSLAVSYLLLARVGGSLATAQSEFPSCSWTTNSYRVFNWAQIDTAAVYWTFDFIVQDDMSFTISGTYPDGRYVSLAVFNSNGGVFTTRSGLSSLMPDYKIDPDKDSINPWQSAGRPGGNFTVAVKHPDSGGKSPGVGNILPLAADGTEAGKAGQVTWRTYVNGTENQPPVVTVHIGNLSKVLPLCVERRPVQQLPDIEIPPSDKVNFLRYGDTDVQANVDTAYLFATLKPPTNDQVLVIRSLSPRSSTGNDPKPWPTSKADVRYWSLCNSILEQPFPVVYNGANQLGCKYDTQFDLDDKGYYLAVVGTENKRDEIGRIPHSTFIPFSTEHPDTLHGLIFRQILAAPDFQQGTKHVKPGSNVTETAAVMGEYHPSSSFCSLKTLKEQGLEACIVNEA